MNKYKLFEIEIIKEADHLNEVSLSNIKGGSIAHGDDCSCNAGTLHCDCNSGTLNKGQSENCVFFE